MTSPADDLWRVFQDVRAAAQELRLPEVSESTWFGTPSLKVRQKSLLRVKDRDTLVLMCPREEKELLLEAAPDIYFETDHYRGWPAVLARASAISREELKHRILVAWRMQAPKRLVKAFDQSSRNPAGEIGAEDREEARR